MTPKLTPVPGKAHAKSDDIEQLVETYRLADEESQRLLEQASRTLSSTADPLSKAQAARSIQQSALTANQAFDRIVSSKASTIEGLLSKLDLWHECVVGTNMSQLSPMERLLCSVHEDLSMIVNSEKRSPLQKKAL